MCAKHTAHPIKYTYSRARADTRAHTHTKQTHTERARRQRDDRTRQSLCFYINEINFICFFFFICPVFFSVAFRFVIVNSPTNTRKYTKVKNYRLNITTNDGSRVSVKSEKKRKFNFCNRCSTNDVSQMNWVCSVFFSQNRIVCVAGREQ